MNSLPKIIEEFSFIFDGKKEKKSLASQFWRNLHTNISRITPSIVQKISHQTQSSLSLNLKCKYHDNYGKNFERSDLFISNLITEVNEKKK